jgi:hypothetical protein
LLGCNQEETKRRVVVEQVNAYKPALPQVPSIPKPTAPETYSDGTYSVYGLRKNIVKTIETQVTLTAYIAEVYQKPVCGIGVKATSIKSPAVSPATLERGS